MLATMNNTFEIPNTFKTAGHQLGQHNIRYCVKSVRIPSFSGPYFPAFRLNMERYGVTY